MNQFYFLIKLKIIASIAIIVLFPFGVFAQVDKIICSPVGYTIATINGVFTNEEEAIKNKRALEDKLDREYNGEPLTVDYLHNPSHLGGLGDIAMSVYQKIFDNGTVEDYDLIEMLKTASEKVKTQKLLIVAHSQGNFYANSFYDTVSGKDGGIPNESIGIYSVATPAGRIAGEGKWLTSDTDKVIAGIVKRAPFKKIMSPNTSIVLKDGDDSLGHNFKDIYLKYRSKEIVSDIRESLDKLKENKTQDSQKNCIDPPKLTLAHKVAGVFLNSADLAINTGVETAVFAKKEIYDSAVVLANTAKETVAGVASLAKTSFSLFELNKNDLAGNLASVVNIAKTETKGSDSNISVVPKIETTVLSESDKGVSDQDKMFLVQKKLDDIKKQVIALEQRKLIEDKVPKPTPKTDILPINNEDKKTNAEKLNEPRLLFVGMIYPGFGGGGEVSQIQTTIIEQVSEESIQETAVLSAPIVSVPQCDYSLTVDGCLLATTTVIFFWQSVSNADYYGINKNGEYSTTTDLFFNASIADFSDYNFSISAISSATTSATTTAQTVSVATIPIAINEIAWMGTQASSYDEWMELKNNTGHRINLSQWAIESADSFPYIVLSGEMSPYEYRVLERRESAITAKAVVSSYGSGSSQWALGNNGEELTLYFASTALDKSPIVSGDNWIAGENISSTTKKTMERINSKQSGATTTNWATWGTNVNFIKNGNDADNNQILGTPGECNSASFVNLNGGQNIASSTTLEANNCYYISSQSMGLSVSASSTLTVEEGVRVSLYQNNLIVNGALVASGTPDNPIIVDSFSGNATMNGIKISGNNGTSTMNNIVVSNIMEIYLDNSASLEISNANFENNYYGIELNNGSSVVVENSSFASTTREALSAYDGSSISVASSTISDTLDADAIGVYDSSLSMSSTTIDTVLDGDGIGLYDSVAVISSSTINNILDGDGVYAYQSTVEIASSTVSNIYDGEGIGVYNSVISIASSTISNVLDGEGLGVYDSKISVSSSTVSNIYNGDGLGLYDSTTTISNVAVENVSDDGITVDGGTISGNAIVEGMEVEF